MATPQHHQSEGYGLAHIAPVRTIETVSLITGISPRSVERLERQAFMKLRNNRELAEFWAEYREEIIAKESRWSPGDEIDVPAISKEWMNQTDFRDWELN